MTKAELKKYIEQRDEIEFTYKGKKYSITYFDDKGSTKISFCEFYKSTTDVETFDELCNIQRDGVTVLKMWESLDPANSEYTIF